MLLQCTVDISIVRQLWVRAEKAEEGQDAVSPDTRHMPAQHAQRSRIFRCIALCSSTSGWVCITVCRKGRMYLNNERIIVRFWWGIALPNIMSWCLSVPPPLVHVCPPAQPLCLDLDSSCCIWRGDPPQKTAQLTVVAPNPIHTLACGGVTKEVHAEAEWSVLPQVQPCPGLGNSHGTPEAYIFIKPPCLQQTLHVII